MVVGFQRSRRGSPRRLGMKPRARGIASVMPRLSALIALIALTSTAIFAWAEEEPPSPAEKTTTPDIPLPEIPKLDPVETPVPKQEAVKGLSGRLDELLHTSIADPLDQPNLGFLTEDLDDETVAAIRQRMAELREQMDGAAAERLLEEARKAGKKALKKAKGDDDGDWLVFMLSLGNEESDTWRDAVALYGMLRMLEAIGTTPAVRQMVESYSYFGELVRIDLQRGIGRLEHRAVPALIEARQHDAKKVRSWAARQLDTLGRAIPGEAVSTTDPQILADVLRAFGRTREVDATRVILSFTSSDRAQLREAAREAIGAIGEPATWHLKDTYQNLTGEKAPRGWDWKQTARELFRMHDRERLAPVYESMAQGKNALDVEKMAEAVAAFDRVLARDPLFPSRSEMAPAYLGRAKELALEGKEGEATALLRKARRLLAKDADLTAIEAELTYLEAKALVDAGTPDRFLIERAIELAPEDARARALRDGLAEKSEQRQTRSKKYGAAIGIGALALVLLIFLARFRRAQKQAPPPAANRDDAEPAAAKAESEPAPPAGTAPTMDETPTVPQPTSPSSHPPGGRDPSS